MACNHASEATYKAVQDSILRRSPNLNILSYYSVKKLVLEITGVGSILDDMCINSCLAFVGPLADLKQCPECLELRYDPEKRPLLEKKSPDCRHVQSHSAHNSKLFDNLLRVLPHSPISMKKL